MKKYSLIPSLLLVMMAACTQKEEVSVVPAEDPVVAEQPVPVTYIYANGTETKASVDGTSGAFTWNTKDRIAVYTTDGYKLSDELASTYNGTNSATFSFTGDHAITEANRTDLAIFPASLVFNETSPGEFEVRTATASNHMVITLPASYKLAQVQDNVTPTPKIATNAPDGGLSFKSICALVRITVNNISKDASYLKVTFPGKKVQGEFTLTNEMVGTAGVVTSNTDGTDDTITITDLGISAFTSGLVINVPVPTGVAGKEYTDVVIGAYDENDHKIHSICTPVKATAWAPGRTAARKVTANLPVFSVGASKKAVFAPGNLRAVLSSTVPVFDDSDGSSVPGIASSWHFAANQYTAIGNTTANTLQSPAEKDVIDLFAWFGESMASSYTDGKEYGIFHVASSGNGAKTGSQPEALLSDWGNNAIDTYGAGTTWTTPTNDYWKYVLETRTGDKYTKALIGTVGGLIIIPDNYTHPLATAFSSINTATANYSANTITLENWEKLEAAGCVFLPSTGTRSYNSGNVISNASNGYYWSSTSKASGGQVYYVTFSDSNYQRTGQNRQYGCAVRLVRDVN